MTYTELIDQVNRKMLLDLETKKIDIDEFRRISRGLSDIAAYLDHKKLSI